jgi:choline dehydrogenase-like flavoprotein
MRPAGPADSQDAAWGFHHMGTTRMAAEPSGGVVDVNCLVFGTTNLYVAGSSVFPTGGCANPTFMIVTLAHRLVDHLTRDRGAI